MTRDELKEIINECINETVLIDEAVKFAYNCELKRVIDSCKKKVKVGKFTVLFMEECDYNKEKESIKNNIKEYEDNINNTLKDDNELSEFWNNSSDKHYYLEYLLDDPELIYVVFKTKLNKKDKYLMVQFKYNGTKIKSYQFQN